MKCSYVDAHCHLTYYNLDEVMLQVTKAKEKGIEIFLQGGVDPQEWQKQIEVKKKIKGLVPVFGIHPCWIAQNSLRQCEDAYETLRCSLENCKALGEIGLDGRTDYVLKLDQQKLFFERQLQLAIELKMPIVLHVVYTHATVSQLLAENKSVLCGGLVHAFSGSAQEAKKYLDLGFHLSVGVSLCRATNQKLKNVVKNIPLEKLFIETDAPDGLHEIADLIQVAQVVAECHQVTVVEVLEKTRDNFYKVFLSGARCE